MGCYNVDGADLLLISWGYQNFSWVTLLVHFFVKNVKLVF